MKKTALLLIGVTTLSLAFVSKVMLKGIDTASMDPKASARDDFYQYSNGTWCRNNPVPAAEPRWTSFNILAEKNTEMLHKILKESSEDKDAIRESNRHKVGTFYRIAMDTVKLERDGLNPMMQSLERVNTISTKTEVMLVISEMQRRGMNPFFAMDISQDIKNSDRYICYLHQSGLGLPDRDYYTKSDEKSIKIREAYKRYINEMFMAYRLSSPGSVPADVIMKIESDLASASMTRVERRDQEKQYNKRTITELKNAYSDIDWTVYLSASGLTEKQVNELIVAQPDFFAKMNSLFQSTNMEEMKMYLRWKLINGTTPYLNQMVSTLSFNFYGKMLNGTQEQKPRWKRVVNSANSLIGELLAQEYVKVAFSPESKRRVNEMVDNLRSAFRARIEKLDWMSPVTKQKAMEKLASFNRKLGYPDKWKDYSALHVYEDNYLLNYFRASEFAYNDMMSKLGKPVDKSEWEMLPQTVNAYYNPVMNEIVFPAAIMQPPFFDPNADDAVNYGAIGAVIGHEFSHGFDDQGSKYDAAGNMNEWWTVEDRNKFKEKTNVLVQQYNGFEVEENVRVNGELTLGENIADFAGLTVAYDAYQISLAKKKRETIDGFSPEQRFFIGYAQVWKNNARPEYLRQQVMTDPHSPGRFRVLGPLSNMPAFYQAFGVQPGDKMYREEAIRARIW